MAQLYQTNIDSFEQLQYVANAVEHFNFDKFVYVLIYKNVPVSEVSELRAKMLDVNAKLTEELGKLQSYSGTFNKEFVTEHNDYFSSAYHLLRKVKTGTAQVKNIFRQFTPNNAAAIRMVNPNNVKPDIYRRSALGGAEYMPSLFTHENFSPDVNSLYEATREFMMTMHQCLELCIAMLREEHRIRLSKSKCQKLYQKFKDEQYSRIKSIIKSINLDTSDFTEQNPAILLRNRARSEEEFAQKGFHALTVSDAAGLASKELVQAAKRGEFTEDELLLFKQDEKKIRLVRHIIQNFDSYLPENFKHKKLPAKYIACLLRWCAPQEAKAFVEYFGKTYLENSPQHTVPNNSAVNQQKGKLDEKRDDDYKMLVEKWKNVEFD